MKNLVFSLQTKTEVLKSGLDTSLETKTSLQYYSCSKYCPGLHIKLQYNYQELLPLKHQVQLSM